jgi:hypothetical protein
MLPMARGWESKSVEEQVQGRDEKELQSRKHYLSSSELELRRRKEILLLSRVRVQRDLELSQNPRYRDQLMRALSDIESQIAALDNST